MVPLGTVEPELFSISELSKLVRRMIVQNQKDGHDLTTTIGGIDLRYVVDIAEDHRTLYGELRGPKWTLMVTMEQDDGRMEFNDLIHVIGDRERFDADIIYLKIALS